MVLVWYFDKYIVLQAGRDVFGHDVKMEHTMVDQELDVFGMKKCFISAGDEACGSVGYLNYFNPWFHKAKWNYDKYYDAAFADNGGWDPSKGAKPEDAPQCSLSDKNTHHLKAKWSNSANGKMSNWHQDALEHFSQEVVRIEQLREKDKERGWKPHKKANTFVRLLHKVNGAQNGPESAKPKGKGKASRFRDHPSRITTVAIILPNDD